MRVEIVSIAMYQEKPTTVWMKPDLLPVLKKVQEARKFPSRTHTVRVLLMEHPQVKELIEKEAEKDD